MRFIQYKSLYIFSISFVFFVSAGIAYAEDSDSSRRTLAGFRGVYVAVEDLQPNLKMHAENESITSAQLKFDIEKKLRSNGIRVLSKNEWSKTPGRPMLYLNINTHPSGTKSLVSRLLSDHKEERVLFAFDIKLELRQVVYLEANPYMRTLSTTWSLNMTGLVNVANIAPLRTNVLSLVDQFISSYQSANRGR